MKIGISNAHPKYIIKIFKSVMSWSDDNSELLEGFVSESRDALDSINPMFVEVIDCLNDGGRVDDETLNCIFRLFHTMKGSAGFFESKCVG